MCALVSAKFFVTVTDMCACAVLHVGPHHDMCMLVGPAMHVTIWLVARSAPAGQLWRHAELPEATGVLGAFKCQRG